MVEPVATVLPIWPINRAKMYFKVFLIFLLVAYIYHFTKGPTIPTSSPATTIDSEPVQEALYQDVVIETPVNYDHSSPKKKASLTQWMR